MPMSKQAHGLLKANPFYPFEDALALGKYVQRVNEGDIVNSYGHYVVKPLDALDATLLVCAKWHPERKERAGESTIGDATSCGFCQFCTGTKNGLWCRGCPLRQGTVSCYEGGQPFKNWLRAKDTNIRTTMANSIFSVAVKHYEKIKND